MAADGSAPIATRAPKFVRLVTGSRQHRGAITVHVGAATMRVEAGFDAELLRAVVSALSAGSR